MIDLRIGNVGNYGANKLGEEGVRDIGEMMAVQQTNGGVLTDISLQSLRLRDKGISLL